MELIIRRRRVHRVARKVFLDRENPFDCDDAVFFKRYRFTKEIAIDLIEDLQPMLKRPTSRSKSIPPHLIVCFIIPIYFS